MVVVLGDALDHLFADLRSLLSQLGRNLPLAQLARSPGSLEEPRLLVDQVDHALELVLGAYGVLHRNRRSLQPVAYRVHRLLEVRAHAVHLVHEADARHPVTVGLTPHRLGLRLHARDRIEHNDASVENAEASLYLGREVHVPRRIDDVDLMALPLCASGRRSDGDPSLPLLGHPVHDGGAVVNLSQLVRPAREEQHPLRHCRLASVDVGDEPDIANFTEVRIYSHSVLLTTGSGRRLCWPPPCGALPRGGGRRFPARVTRR